jgi:hypothetical protein
VKRPKDMTDSELKALPIGPIEERFEPYTAEDVAAGARGRGRMVPTGRRAKHSAYQPDDIFAAWIDGRHWSFGQFTDGTWYRA